MVKKLRYYARFIVVCLLLKKMKLVRDLVRELSKLIGTLLSLSLSDTSFILEYHEREHKFSLNIYRRNWYPKFSLF